MKAVRAYARHQQNEGKPIAHPHAKEAIAAIASAEVCCQYVISNNASQDLVTVSLIVDISGLEVA
jgi:Protein of unknown function (DUF3759)